VHYLNSGDWIESNTALVEHFNGSFEILPYETFCDRLERENAASTPLTVITGKRDALRPADRPTHDQPAEQASVEGFSASAG
jgi:hypothetical protein